ncbi:MAG: hypothetical protein SGARI_002475 [Bacillariaceae sp.]
MHSSWSHPDQVVKSSPGQKMKKGKRKSNSDHSINHKNNGGNTTNSSKCLLNRSSNHSTSKRSERKATAKHAPPKLKPKPVVAVGDDSDSDSDASSSSSDSDLEAAAAEMLSPERKARYIKNVSLNKSSLAQQTITKPEDYDGDFIRIKVKKISESNPGIKVKKMAGIFVLADLPATETRINTGSQVLAINGVMNINTVTKAESLIRQVKGYVTLMVDFSFPTDKRRVCPCCGDQIYGNGQHVVGGDRTTSASQNPDDSGLFTPKMNNHSGHGPSRTTVSSKYNLDEYMSETEDSDDDQDDDDDGRAAAFERTYTSKFQPGDKFMIRVNNNYNNTNGSGSGNPGISLFDYRGSDKLMSMNGKKAELIKTASNAMSMLEGKEIVSLYVCRSDKSSAEYREAIKRRRN